MKQTYTKEDLERATEFARNKAYGLKALAKLIADVRREERERCAKIVRTSPSYWTWDDIAEHIASGSGE